VGFDGSAEDFDFDAAFGVDTEDSGYRGVGVLKYRRSVATAGVSTPRPHREHQSWSLFELHPRVPPMAARAGAQRSGSSLRRAIERRYRTARRRTRIVTQTVGVRPLR
jgi:hypothetical protein